jgi:hypothetical protein
MSKEAERCRRERGRSGPPSRSTKHLRGTFGDYTVGSSGTRSLAARMGHFLLSLSLVCVAYPPTRLACQRPFDVITRRFTPKELGRFRWSKVRSPTSALDRLSSPEYLSAFGNGVGRSLPTRRRGYALVTGAMLSLRGGSVSFRTPPSQVPILGPWACVIV